MSEVFKDIIRQVGAKFLGDIDKVTRDLQDRWRQRQEVDVRDLLLASARLWITCQYRKVFCVQCQGIHIEDL